MAALEADDATDVAGDVQEWTLLHVHQRFSHLAFDTIERMAKKPASDTNAQQQQDRGMDSPIDRIGGVIFSDLKGPMTPQDRLQNRYLVRFVDPKSNYCRIFLARTKDAAKKQFEAFLVHFKKRFGFRIHVLRTDGGGEYANIDLLCKRTGATRHISEFRNQASNDKAERMHRTVLNLARSMMFACALPLNFWGDEVLYAVYILNRSPSRANDKRASPLEVLAGVAPDLRKIVVFGSHCHVYRDSGKSALQQRSQIGTIVGIAEDTKGYKVYLCKDNKVIVTQHIKGVDTLTDKQSMQLQRAMTDEGDEETDDTVTKPSKKPWTRQAHGTRGASKRANETAQQEGPQASGEVVTAAYERDPKSYSDAMKSAKRCEWKRATEEEVAALQDNDVCRIKRRASGMNALHTKWVYKTKTDAQRILERHKARPVASGYEQVFGVDYSLTFAHGDIPNAYVKAEKEANFD
ncbi:unnamed protein product [Hyaloperonospora brassicae]|uniref:Integrase catalytic domain-containing protein n=1 Tax=Hyaloperonospora brassicae TaxID=162125 RepID=A0AAV0UC38_HYABA|nr:unnamed protein product [Hyaloperonospora brassicae]